MSPVLLESESATHASTPGGEPLDSLERLEFEQELQLRRLLDRYSAKVMTRCLRLTRDWHDAEDATQQTFVALSRRLAEESVRGPIENPEAWLMRVSKRCAIDLMRSRQTRRKYETQSAIDARLRDDQTHDDATARVDSKLAVEDVLRTLPSRHQTPLVLFYFGGQTLEQIAEQLGMKPNAVGVRLHRARAMLAKRLRARGVVMSAAALSALLVETVRLKVVASATAGAGASAGASASAGVGASSLASVLGGWSLASSGRWAALAWVVGGRVRGVALMAFIVASAGAVAGNASSLMRFGRDAIDRVDAFRHSLLHPGHWPVWDLLAPLTMPQAASEPQESPTHVAARGLAHADLTALPPIDGRTLRPADSSVVEPSIVGPSPSNARLRPLDAARLRQLPDKGRPGNRAARLPAQATGLPASRFAAAVRENEPAARRVDPVAGLAFSQRSGSAEADIESSPVVETLLAVAAGTLPDASAIGLPEVLAESSLPMPSGGRSAAPAEPFRGVGKGLPVLTIGMDPTDLPAPWLDPSMTGPGPTLDPIAGDVPAIELRPVVPEPTVGLLVVGTATLLLRRRRSGSCRGTLGAC